MGYVYRPVEENSNGFRETSNNSSRAVVSLKDVIAKIKTAYGGKEKRAYRTYFPCYVDICDKTTLRFVLIIRPIDENATDEKKEEIRKKIEECDKKYESIPYEG